MSYCTTNDVNSLFGDISDEVSETLFTTVISNSDAWIEANLKRNYVPLPTTVPSALKTAAIYYAASDVLLSLYHGDELPVQYDVWFNKAQSLLDDYIDAYKNSEAEESELISHQMVKSTHGKTYNQKRGRRGIRRWVR